MADIENEVEHLSHLLDDLLLLTRAELGPRRIAEPILVQRAIEGVCARWRRIRPHRRIELQLAESLVPVAGEQTYLEQVLRNLLSNADKYSPPEAPIEVRASTNGVEVVISVLDDGPGIAAEEAERIFERFYRSGRTARTARGLGIGLTVCKRLVEAQAGRIWAQPRDGGGLEVAFTLPIYKEVDS